MFEKGKKSVSNILATHEKTVTLLEERETEMGNVIDRAEAELERIATRKKLAKREKKRANHMVTKFRELLSFDDLEDDEGDE